MHSPVALELLGQNGHRVPYISCGTGVFSDQWEGMAVSRWLHDHGSIYFVHAYYCWSFLNKNYAGARHNETRRESRSRLKSSLRDDCKTWWLERVIEMETTFLLVTSESFFSAFTSVDREPIHEADGIPVTGRNTFIFNLTGYRLLLIHPSPAHSLWGPVSDGLPIEAEIWKELR